MQSFRFLRVTDVTEGWRVWAHLLKPGYVREFAQLFNRYAIRCVPYNDYFIYHTNPPYRTMKSTVKDELTIPKQTRYLVPVEMGRVERHVSLLR